MGENKKYLKPPPRVYLYTLPVFEIEPPNDKAWICSKKYQKIVLPPKLNECRDPGKQAGYLLSPATPFSGTIHRQFFGGSSATHPMDQSGKNLSHDLGWINIDLDFFRFAA